MAQSLIHPDKQSQLRVFGLLALIAVVWFAVYNLIQPLADWIAYGVFNLARGSHLGDAIAFFLYDNIPINFIVCAIGVVSTHIYIYSRGPGCRPDSAPVNCLLLS